MASEGSVTGWIREVKAGEESAAQKLWERYFDLLVRFARKKLGTHRRRVADEEDLALSSFKSFCISAARGRYPLLQDRDNLWRLLIVMTARKVQDQIQYQNRKKRGGAMVRGESALAAAGGSGDEPGFDSIAGSEPTPEFAALVAEEERILLEDLGLHLREVALRKMEGYTNDEIAEKLNCSRRTVARKLLLIRKRLEARNPP